MKPFITFPDVRVTSFHNQTLKYFFKGSNGKYNVCAVKTEQSQTCHDVKENIGTL